MVDKGRGQYRAGWLKKEWEGTAREGYRYSVGYAPTGAATCKGCNQKIAKGGLRIGRSTPNPFDAEGGASDMTQFFHVDHGFEVMMRSRCTSRVPASASDIKGMDSLISSDRKRVTINLRKFVSAWRKKCRPAARVTMRL